MYSLFDILNYQFSISNPVVSRADPERGQGGQDRPGKSQVAIGFLGNTGIGTPQEEIGPIGSNCF